jgi:hypothetical protein
MLKVQTVYLIICLVCVIGFGGNRPMDLEFTSRLAKWVIGFGFLWIPVWLIWLYYHRRTDWPKAWSLMLLGVSMGACGISRIAHAIDDPPEDNLYTTSLDIFTAVIILVVDGFLPWAVVVLLKLPTPKEWEHAQRAKMQKEQVQWLLSQETKAKEEAQLQAKKMEQKLTEIVSYMRHSNLSQDQQDKIIHLLREDGV